MPPLRTATTFAPVGAATRPCSSAATGSRGGAFDDQLRMRHVQIIASKIFSSGQRDDLVHELPDHVERGLADAFHAQAVDDAVDAVESHDVRPAATLSCIAGRAG